MPSANVNEQRRIEDEIRIVLMLHEREFEAQRTQLEVEALQIELEAAQSIEGLRGNGSKSISTDSISNIDFEDYLRLVRDVENKVTGSERDKWLGELKEKYEQVISALEQGLSQGKIEGALTMVGLLSSYWYFTDNYKEGLKWLERTIKYAEGRKPSRAFATALFGAGLLYRAQGNIERARHYLSRSVTILEAEVLHQKNGSRIESIRRYAFALAFLGLTERDAPESSNARQYLDHSIKLFQENQPLDWAIWGEALARSYLGMAKLRLSRDHKRKDPASTEAKDLLAEAIDELNRSLESFRLLRDAWGVAQAMIYIGVATHQYALFEEGARNQNTSDAYEEAAKDQLRSYLEYLMALPMNRQGSDIVVRTIDNRRGLTRCLCGVAALVNKQGKPDVALKLLGAAEAIRNRLHALLVVNDILGYMDTFKSAYTQARKHPYKVSDARDAYLAGEKMSDIEAMRLAHRYLLPIEPITLTTRHNQGERCEFCGGKTSRTQSRQEFWSKYLTFESHLPSYECRSCRIEAVSLEAYIEFLTKVIHRIGDTGNQEELRKLQGELSLLQKHQISMQAST